MNKNFGLDPRKIPGCSLWLDATDSSTLSLTGSVVNSWKDKSSNAFTGTSSGGPTLVPNSQNGLPCISFSAASSQYFNFGDILPQSAFALFIVMKTTFVPGVTQAIIGKSSNSGENSRWTFIYYSSNIYTIIQNGGGPFAPAAPYSGSFTLFDYVVGSIETSLYANATAVSASGPWPHGFTTNNNYILIGAYQNPAGTVPPTAGDYYNGIIGEIIYYNTTITVEQRQQVEGYLTQKWGLKDKLPLAHPGNRQLFYATKKLPLARPITSLVLPTPIVPNTIPNCLLWLDGADSTTMGLSGSTLTTWNDKSGGARNATVYGSPTWITGGINGKNAVYMPNAPYFQGALTISGSNYTCFSVASTTRALPNGTIDMRLVSFTSNTGVDFGLVGTSIGLFVQGYSSGIGTYRTGWIASNVILQNTPFLAVSQYDGTRGYLWGNGLEGNLASTASTGNFSINKYTIGNRGDNSGEFWQGYIGEVIVYSRSLTVSERQSVESYLSGKWGTPYTIRVSGGKSAIAFPFKKL